MNEFCAMLRLDIVELLDSVPNEVKLTAIYRMLINTLSNDPNRVHTWRLLLLLLAGIPVADTEILRRLWLHGNYGTHRQNDDPEIKNRLARVSLDQALRDLQRLALVKVSGGTNVNADLIRPETGIALYSNVTMHTLTHKIMRSLVNPEAITSAERVFLTIKTILDEADWRGGLLFSTNGCTGHSRSMMHCEILAL